MYVGFMHPSLRSIHILCRLRTTATRHLTPPLVRYV
jgi:hypothetical protein